MDWHPIRGGGARREVSKTHLIQAIETHNSGRVGILRIVYYFLTFSSFASRQGATEWWFWSDDSSIGFVENASQASLKLTSNKDTIRDTTVGPLTWILINKKKKAFHYNSRCQLRTDEEWVRTDMNTLDPPLSSHTWDHVQVPLRRSVYGKCRLKVG